MSRVEINPELEIGTRFWVIRKNKISMGLISAYDVHVTSRLDENESWWEQLFLRFKKGTHKQYKFKFRYTAKVEDDFYNYGIEKKHNRYWYMQEHRMYFSLDEIKEAHQ